MRINKHLKSIGLYGMAGLIGLGIGRVTVPNDDALAMADTLPSPTKVASKNILASNNVESKKSDLSIAAKDSDDSDEDIELAVASEELIEELKFLEGSNVDMVMEGDRQAGDDFMAWVAEASDPAAKLFELLTSDVDESHKALVEYMLTMKKHGLEGDVVEALLAANPEDLDTWGDVLGMVRVSTTEPRNKLLDALPGIDNPAFVADTLMAIDPEYVSVEERQDVLARISMHADDPNPEVKASSLIALGKWGGSDYDNLIADEIEFGSEELQFAAISVAGIPSIATPRLKGVMIGIMNDSNSSIGLRRESFASLGSYNLSEEEYAQVSDFHQEHIQPLKEQLFKEYP